MVTITLLAFLIDMCHSVSRNTWNKVDLFKPYLNKKTQEGKMKKKIIILMLAGIAVAAIVIMGIVHEPAQKITMKVVDVRAQEKSCMMIAKSDDLDLTVSFFKMANGFRDDSGAYWRKKCSHMRPGDNIFVSTTKENKRIEWVGNRGTVVPNQ